MYDPPVRANHLEQMVAHFHQMWVSRGHAQNIGVRFMAGCGGVFNGQVLALSHASHEQCHDAVILGNIPASPAILRLSVFAPVGGHTTATFGSSGEHATMDLATIRLL